MRFLINEVKLDPAENPRTRSCLLKDQVLMLPTEYAQGSEQDTDKAPPVPQQQPDRPFPQYLDRPAFCIHINTHSHRLLPLLVLFNRELAPVSLFPSQIHLHKPRFQPRSALLLPRLLQGSCSCPAASYINLTGFDSGMQRAGNFYIIRLGSVERSRRSGQPGKTS